MNEILQCFVCWKHGMEFTKKVFHAHALCGITDITFQTDENGKWNGEWSSGDEEDMQDILDEPCEIDLSLFQNLKTSDDETEQPMLLAEDASVATFRTALAGRPQPGGLSTPGKTEEDGDVASASPGEAAATPQEVAGGGAAS